MNSIYYLNKRDFEKNNTDVYYKELSKRIKTLKQQGKKPILISEYDKELLSKYDIEEDNVFSRNEIQASDCLDIYSLLCFILYENLHYHDVENNKTILIFDNYDLGNKNMIYSDIFKRLNERNYVVEYWFLNEKDFINRWSFKNSINYIYNLNKKKVEKHYIPDNFIKIKRYGRKWSRIIFRKEYGNNIDERIDTIQKLMKSNIKDLCSENDLIPDKSYCVNNIKEYRLYLIECEIFKKLISRPRLLNQQYGYSFLKGKNIFLGGKVFQK